VARAYVIGFASPLLSSKPRLTLLHTTHKSREMPIFAVMDSAAYYGCCPNVSGTPPSSPLDKGAFRLHADCRCARGLSTLTTVRSGARLSGCVRHTNSRSDCGVSAVPNCPSFLSIFPQLPRRLLRRRHRPPAAQRRHGGVSQGTCCVSHTHGGARLAAL
jgi:hypothetical protein